MCIKHSVRTWGHTQPDKDYRWVPSPPPATPGAQAGPVSQAGTLLTKTRLGRRHREVCGQARPHPTRQYGTVFKLRTHYRPHVHQASLSHGYSEPVETGNSGSSPSGHPIQTER